MGLEETITGLFADFSPTPAVREPIATLLTSHPSVTDGVQQVLTAIVEKRPLSSVVDDYLNKLTTALSTYFAACAPEGDRNVMMAQARRVVWDKTSWIYRKAQSMTDINLNHPLYGPVLRTYLIGHLLEFSYAVSP